MKDELVRLGILAPYMDYIKTNAPPTKQVLVLLVYCTVLY
jgi:hypothetical protein